MHSNVSGRRVAAGLGVLTVVLALGACSSGGGHGGHNGGTSAPNSPVQPSAVFNDADVTFATGMIPHHGQAVRMAELAATRTTNEKLLALATAIKGAQQPEIDKMTTWLRDWGKPVPDVDGGHGGHGAMPGMMSPEEMGKLTAAEGAAFDRLFLEMMIRHHEGAVTMSAEEQAKGANPEAKALAAQITAAQQAEIATMRGLLAG